MSKFKTTRSRDARATIQGYVYQVDLTIQRWLNLQPPQILELEYGEDIDIVSRSLATTNLEEQERLLEQVKHREKKITLKNPAAVTMIACAIEHLNTNPNSNLIFRYTTNTEATRERLSPIPDNTPGISVWEQIRSGSLSGKPAKARLNNIRSILKQASRPPKLHDDTWKAYSIFVKNSNDTELLDLVCSLEWGMNTSEAKSLGQEIQNTLLSQQHAEDTNRAKEQYQRLFLYVFKCLCQSGRKQLTKQELQEQLALPLLSEKDRLLLDNITTWINIIEQRLSVVEDDVSQNKEFISTIDDRVKQLAKAQGIEASIKYTIATPVLDLPPLVSHLSLRQKTVASLAKTFEHHTWLAIHGSMGSGKTQLANLIVRSSNNCCVWIRLRNLSIEQAAMRLDEACKTLLSPLSNNWYEWYSAICQKLDCSAIIVLDNLPNLSRGDELSERLIQLTRACQNHQVRLLSTSAYNLPPSFQSNLPNDALHSLQIPILSEEEAAEILEKYNIPTTKTDNFIRFLNDIARQHPLLLNAVGQYLELKNWQLTEEDLDGLFRNSFAAEVNDETIDRLLATVEDSNARELLYRLNLVIGSFSLDDARAIASVEPSIGSCRERLRSLTGLWLESDTNENLQVSALIDSLGNEDLPEQTQKKCYVVLGNRVIQQRKLDRWDARKAILYYANAKEYGFACNILISILWELYKSKAQIDDANLLSFWASTPLPEQIDLTFRLFLRGLQIGLRHKYDKSTKYLIADLDLLIQKASKQESWAIISATTLANSAIAENQPMRANNNLRTALKLLPHAKNPFNKNFLFPNDGLFAIQIWFNIHSINNTDHLIDWIETVECLSPEQLERAFACEIAEHGCQFVTENLYLLEAEKPQEQRQWNAILDVINEFAYRSYRLELKFLWACAVRVQIGILGDINELEIANDIANAVIDRSNDDPRIQLLIGECMGRQYVNAHRISEAKTWLNLALEQTTTSCLNVRLDALMLRGRIIEDENYEEPLIYIRQAVELAEEQETESSKITLVKAWGELAIAQWLTKGIRETFEPWEKAINYLLKYQKDTDDWKSLSMVCRHVLGYFAYLASNGIPPEVNLYGSPYAAPELGLFSKYNPHLARNSGNHSQEAIFVLLSNFAEAVGNDQKVAYWGLKGIDNYRANGKKAGFPTLCCNVTPKLLLDDKYIETVDLSLDAGAILVAHEKLLQTTSNVFSIDNVDVDEILGAKSNNIWRRVENYAAHFSLVPIAFHLCTLMLSQSEIIETRAKEVVDICRQVNVTATDRYLWTSAAELFEILYRQDISVRELIDRSNIFAEEYDMLWAIGYLISSVLKTTTLRNALKAQFHLTKSLYAKDFKPTSTTYRRLILPFLQTYWTTTFNKMRFQFRTPRLIEERLAEVENIPEAQRAQSIFKIISLGLDVNLSDELKQWNSTLT